MKRIFALILVLALAGSLAVPVFAEDAPLLILDNPTSVYVVDDADLLTSEEEARLEESAREISQRQACDVVLGTASYLNGATPMEYADDYFDYNGYGYGEDRTGILLLVSMEDRDVWVSTRGEAIQAFTDDGIQYLIEQLFNDLSYGDYAGAFSTYYETADTMLSVYRGTASTQEAEDFNESFDDFVSDSENEWNEARESNRTGRILFRTVIALVIGLLGAFIPMSVLKSQVRNVHMKTNAANYMRPNSLNLTRNRDVYLYANTTSRVIETNRGNGGGHGGSSVHISSSGATHGGGGRKF